VNVPPKKGSTQIITSTQSMTSMEQLQFLEDRSSRHRSEYSEESTSQAPVFTSSIKNITIKEGQRAHFECRLIPVSDPTMKVEWFHNNVPLKTGSRFTETNAFGFVALDIMYAYPEDSGTYTCRASNALGQAVTSATLGVQCN
jgi:titin